MISTIYKRCNNCCQEKSSDLFYKDATKRDGLSHFCKDCTKEKRKQHYKTNKSDILERNKKWQQSDIGKSYNTKWYRTDKGKAQVAKYRERNSGRVKQTMSEYYQNNKDRFYESAAKRDFVVSRATPPWADLSKIRKLVRERERITAETGIPHHLDHIVPLQGENVSGLHCEDNLQIITARENLSKGNSWND